MFASRLFWTAAVLVLSTIVLTEGLRMTSGPKKCCFNFVGKQLPRAQMVSYKMTSKQCSNAGVIFITRRGGQVCANPANPWVQEYIKYFDNMNLKKQVQQ
ncbi:C-C motif chemokine 5-like [Scleropages formosus]|uniref:C-C motif chemokine n=1 Tax=Scleropages formosus TaxID=113540 RepID=A0A8C9SQ87_SCLFO|nr:C-C motif chemokine 5-like [Scleropages formosus]